MKDKIKLSGKTVVIPIEKESTVVPGFKKVEEELIADLNCQIEDVLTEFSMYMNENPDASPKLKKVYKLLDQAYDLLDGE